MFALTKREIQDNLVYFIAAAAFSALLVIVLIEAVFEYDPRKPPVVAISLGVALGAIVTFGICGMGAGQMYLDRTRKISAFLSMLPVSRGRILIARITAGILAILILLVPLAIAATILLRLFGPPIPLYFGMVCEMFTATFLVAFACYCIGLQCAWTSSKITPTLGALGLTCIFLYLVIVKGIGPEIDVILVLFIGASLLRTWHAFLSTPL